MGMPTNNMPMGMPTNNNMYQPQANYQQYTIWIFTRFNVQIENLFEMKFERLKCIINMKHF